MATFDGNIHDKIITLMLDEQLMLSYAIHDLVTVDQEIIASDTTLNLSADLLFLEITCTYNS